MTEREQLKIVLLTGYLGAGKTTLLNHILTNRQGIRAAVIVNDIGEVNVDAALIGAGGLAQGEDVIPLTNGCICCTLADDLAQQLVRIARTGTFDYVIIEASGICEPMPISHTINTFCEQSGALTRPLSLDNIVAVVDCARMLDEFGGGADLLEKDAEDDDIAALLIQQIEFCTTLVLNKTDLVTPAQLASLKAIIRSFQRDARIIEAVSSRVPLDELLDTGRFDFDAAYDAAVWAHGEGAGEDERGGGHHAHEHGEGHAHDCTCRSCQHDHEHGRSHSHESEHDITTFVYERNRPTDLEKLAALAEAWPREVVRSKGMLWIAQNPGVRHVFEQAGRQISVTELGVFPEGAQKTKLCVIGRNMDRAAIEAALDACLAE